MSNYYETCAHIIIIIIIIAQANEVLFQFFSFGFASYVNEPVKSVRLSVWVQSFIQLTNGLPGYFVRRGGKPTNSKRKPAAKETQKTTSRTHSCDE